MEKSLEEQIARGKELVDTSRHAAMATVNTDGSPHNTPFYFLHDSSLSHVYWGSHPDSLHSKNVLRTGQIFVVVYDAIERGGLYIRADNAHMLGGEELKAALLVHNTFRAKEGKEPLGLEFYMGDSPQRMWSATTNGFWVNGTKRDAEGLVIKDIRTEITAKDLLNKA